MSRRNRDPQPPPDRQLLAAEVGLDVAEPLLELALTHRSYAYENGGLPTNERLEFLGDSVLGLVVTETLYARHPDLPEGQLAKLRASVVNMRALAGVARRFCGGLGAHILLGRGEESTGGRDTPSILADTLEALLGAVYVAAGMPTAQVLIHRLFDPLLDEAAGRGAALDWKTSLQELAAERALGIPAYSVEEEGPDHAKHFTAQVKFQGRAWGSGTGRSKKEAEQLAAADAFTSLQVAGVDASGRSVPGLLEGLDAEAGDPTSGAGASHADGAASPATGPGDV
jgi:ribonuclease-3